MKKSFLSFIATLAAFFCMLMPASAAASEFAGSNADTYFEEGTVIALIGDSITHGAQVGSYVHTGWFVPLEYYAVTRFPASNVRILNLGTNGITTQQTYSYKLKGEIAQQKIDNAVVYLGTNDVSSYNNKTWKGYYKLLLDGLEELGVKTVTLITPMGDYRTDDGYTRTAGSSAVHKAIADEIKAMAEERKMVCVYQWDIAESLTQVSKETRGTNLMQDGLHPDAAGSAVTFAEFVRAVGLPGEVSTVEISGKYGTVDKASNCTLSGFTVEGNKISYTYLANSLPMSAGADFVAEAQKVFDLLDEVSYETIRMPDLPEGNYQIVIDGKNVVTVSAGQLQEGVNLAKYDTPMTEQSEKVASVIYKLTEEQRALRNRRVCEFRAELYGGVTDRDAQIQWMKERIRAQDDTYTTRYAAYLMDINKKTDEEYLNNIEQFWIAAYGEAQPLEHTVEIISAGGDFVFETKPAEPDVPDTPSSPDTPDTPGTPSTPDTPNTPAQNGGTAAVIAISVAAAVAVLAGVIILIKKHKK